MKHQKSPKARILDAAAKLFFEEPIHSVTLDRIVSEAVTTKMAFYRHYETREVLVAEWLRSVSEQSEKRWQWLTDEHPGDPHRQILGWVRFIGSRLPAEGKRGCPFMNTAAEIAGAKHPAWKVIELHRAQALGHLEKLCRQAHVERPSRVARRILMIVDGAQSNAAAFGAESTAEEMVEMIKLILRSAIPAQRRELPGS